MGGWMSLEWFWGEAGGAAEKERKIVMVGMDNAGKSTILRKLVELDPTRHDDNQVATSLFSRSFVDYGSIDSSSAPSSSSTQKIVNLAPTIGFQMEAVRCGNNGPLLAVWDLGGQTRLRQMWSICYTDARAAIFVVDSTDLVEPRRLHDTRAALTSLLSSPELRGAPLLVLANKSDDARAMTTHQVLETLGLLSSTLTSSSSSSSSSPEPVSYSASLAGYATIPSGDIPTTTTTPSPPSQSSPSSTSHERLFKGRRWWVQATCGLTGEGLEDAFKWLAATLEVLDEQHDAEAEQDSNTRWT